MRTNARTNTAHTATRAAARALAFITAGCVVGIFALTAHGNYGYGRDVMLLGRWWAVAVPVSFDVLQVVAILAAFVLAAAPWRVRAYAWAVFALANLSSIAANLADAQARGLRWQGMVGAGWLPILLSLGVHLAIVAWRHTQVLARSEPTPAPAPAPVVVTPAPRVDRDESDVTRLARRVQVSRTLLPSPTPADPAHVPTPLRLVPANPPPPPPQPAPVNGGGTPEQRTKAAYRDGEHNVTTLHKAYAPHVHIGTVRRWVREVKAERVPANGAHA